MFFLGKILSHCIENINLHVEKGDALIIDEIQPQLIFILDDIEGLAGDSFCPSANYHSSEANSPLENIE